MNMIFTIYVSRLWFWPKKYKVKGVSWGLFMDGDVKIDPATGNPLLNPETGRVERDPPILLDQDIVVLILKNERRVYIDKTGRIITYGRDWFEGTLSDMEIQAGQNTPLAK